MCACSIICSISTRSASIRAGPNRALGRVANLKGLSLEAAGGRIENLEELVGDGADRFLHPQHFGVKVGSRSGRCAVGHHRGQASAHGLGQGSDDGQTDARSTSGATAGRIDPEPLLKRRRKRR